MARLSDSRKSEMLRVSRCPELARDMRRLRSQFPVADMKKHVHPSPQTVAPPEDKHVHE